ncbi:hypothetical protein, partial [Cytobacillus praedii]
MFYEIKIQIYHGNESSSLTTTSYIKRIKPFFKNDLILEAKRQTDSRIINQLNQFYKDCQFDFMKAYHKYGITFWGRAEIKNRLTGRSDTIYDVEWCKNYWDLNLKQYVA